MAAPRIILHKSGLLKDADGKVTEKIYKASGFTTSTAVAAHPNCPVEFTQTPEGFCRSVRIDSIPGGVAHWEIVAEFIQLTIVVPPTEPPATQGGVRIQRTLQPIRVWRVHGSDSALVFPGGDKSAPVLTTDIGGIAVDVGGEPSDLPLPVHILDVTVTVHQPLPELLWDALQGKRNDRVWRGYPIGKVLYLGAQSEGNFNDPTEKVHHSFAVDAWYHLRQVPKLDANTGSPILLGPALTSTTINHGQAKEVYWRQPFPYVANLALTGVS